MTPLQVICGLLPPPIKNPGSKPMRVVFLVLDLKHSCPWPRKGLSSRSRSLAGAYLWGGGIGPWPPLWVARIAKLHKKVSKIEAWPSPPLQVGHQALGSKSPDIGRKMGRNLSMTLSNSDLCSSQILWSFCPPPPPPFQNPAYATGPWPWGFCFFLSPWPQTLGPRLHLCYVLWVTKVETLSNPDFESNYKTTFWGYNLLETWGGNMPSEFSDEVL